MACNGNAHFYVYDAATPHSNSKPTAATGNRLQESPPMIFLRPTGPRDHQLTVCRRHVFLMRFFGQSEDRNVCKICAEQRQSRPLRGTQRTCRSRLNSPTRFRRRSRVRRRCRSGTSGRRGENRGTSTHPREQNGTKSLNSPQKFGLLRSVQCGKCLNFLAGATELEPATSGVTGR
jgi:hypothetical protein